MSEPCADSLIIVREVWADLIADERLANVHGELEMHEALHALPERYREPLLLQVLGGFSCEEIAALMHLSPGAVMTRLSRARLALRSNASGDHNKEASA